MKKGRSPRERDTGQGPNCPVGPRTRPSQMRQRRGRVWGQARPRSLRGTSRSHIKGTSPALLPPNLQRWGLTSPTPKATRPFRVTVICRLVDMKVCPSHPHLAWIGGPGHAQPWGFLELQGHPSPWPLAVLTAPVLRTETWRGRWAPRGSHVGTDTNTLTQVHTQTHLLWTYTFSAQTSKCPDTGWPPSWI